MQACFHIPSVKCANCAPQPPDVIIVGVDMDDLLKLVLEAGDGNNQDSSS